MNNDNAPTAKPVAQGDHARDLRNLIYCSLQFDHRGETDLKHEELLALVNRGWLAEGEENNEFDVTDAGASIMKLVLHQPVMRAECAALKTDAVSDAIKLLRDLQSNIGPLRPDPDEEDERETWDKIDRVVERLAAQPRAVPDGWRETILSVLSALDVATGDSDPNIDPDMNDDEVREEYPEVWAMQQLSAMLAAAPSPGESA